MGSPDTSPLQTVPRGGHPCLRLDTSAGDSLLLPWHQMILARLNAAGTELVVKFGSGDAVIAGAGLGEVREALQRQSAGCVGPGAEPEPSGSSVGRRLIISSVTFKEFNAGAAEDEDEEEQEQEQEEDFR